MKKGLAYWLRWIAVIPGALIAGILASFPLHWILYSTLTKFIDPYPQLPERILFPFVAAIVYIWIGSRIAPDNKIKTAVILFGVWLFLLGGVVFLTLSGTNFKGRGLYFQGGGIGPVMAGVGALVGLYIVKKKTSNSATSATK